MQRQRIVDIVEKNGGEYNGDLTKNVTHLIAATPRGKKYEFARQWGVRIVSPEWLADSLERGMVLDESYYDPILPEHERGKGARNLHYDVATHLVKRTREAEEQIKKIEVGRRKLRRTASAKLGSQNETLWNDITGGSLGAAVEDINHWEDGGVNGADSDAGIAPRRLSAVGKASKLRSTVTATELDMEAQSEVKPQQRAGLFQGRLIYIHGFDSAKVLLSLGIRDSLANLSS